MTGTGSTPVGGRGNGRSPVGVVDHALVTAVRTAVLDKWDAERGDHPRLDRNAERQLFRRYIVEEIEEVGRRRIRDGVPQLTQDSKDHLIRAVESEIHGIGRWQPLLDIPGVEDIRIAVNQSPKLLMQDGTVKEAIDATGAPLRIAESEADLLAQLQFIAAHRGGTERSFSTAHPSLKMPLPDGSRLAALRDVAPYPIVTIRRHHMRGVTLEDLEQRGTISPVMRQFLVALVRARRNILVIGAPKAGKTTLLMALANEIPDGDCFATLETEHELGLHLLPNPHPLLIPLQCRQGSTETDPVTGRRAGEVTLRDLMAWVLAGHSVNRVILGEVVGGEAFDLLMAMNAGLRGSMCTVHADSASEALGRLVTAAFPGAGPGATTTYLNRLAATGIDYIVNVRHIDHTAFGGPRARFVSEIYEVTGQGDPNGAHPFGMTHMFEPIEGDLRGHFRSPPEKTKPFEDVGIRLDFLHQGRSWDRPLALASGGQQP